MHGVMNMNQCICYKLPAKKDFIVGNEYEWTYVIDGIIVINEKREQCYFREIEFMWYFKCE